MKDSLKKKKKTCIRQTSYTLNKKKGKKREKNISWMKDSLKRKQAFVIKYFLTTHILLYLLASRFYVFLIFPVAISRFSRRDFSFLSLSVSRFRVFLSPRLTKTHVSRVVAKKRTRARGARRARARAREKHTCLAYVATDKNCALLLRD